jgi:2-methylcitrate dehydratase PrpD
VNIARLTEGLGSTYHLLDNGLKPHSCCHLIHAHLDALDVVRSKADISPENVKSMKVASNSPQILSHIGSIKEPDDILGAQFSLPFSLAMRLHHGGTGVAGGNGFWDYLNVDLKDPKLLKTARSVECVIADTNKWSDVDKGAGLEVELTDGRLIKEVVPFSKGLPENPMTPAEVREKFISLTEQPLPKKRPEQIIDMVENITDLKDIKRLMDLLIVEKSVAQRYAG